MEQQEGDYEDWPAEVGFREKRRKNPLQRLVLEEAYQGSSCLLKFGFFCFLVYCGLRFLYDKPDLFVLLKPCRSLVLLRRGVSIYCCSDAATIVAYEEGASKYYGAGLHASSVLVWEPKSH